MEHTVLTAKQRAFVDAYSGNATEAARIAGYSDPSYGRHVITKTHVLAAIRNREESEAARRIMNREERQAFWTRVAEDAGQDVKARLRASELLAKSEGDFIPRKENESQRVMLVLNMGRPPEGHEESGERPGLIHDPVGQ